MSHKGNLSNFYPPDLLIFLASSGHDGFLTVNGPDPITITIKQKKVVDAFSPKGDSLLLRVLFLKKIITAPQIQIITKAKKETSLSCRQVLEKLDFFPLKDIQVELIQTVEEVIFQFFLKESGSFQFTDSPIADDQCVIQLLPEELLLDVMMKVDSYNEHLNHLGDLNQLVNLKPGHTDSPASKTEEILAQMAKKHKTISQIINQAPFPNYIAIKALVTGINQQVFLLSQNKELPKTNAAKQPSVFSQYKSTLRKTLKAATLRDKLEEVLHFCKKYFDHTAILSINDNELQQAVCFSKDDNDTLHDLKVIKEKISIDGDRLLVTVCRQGLSYFGKAQESPFLEELFSEDLEGECSLLPFEVKGGHVKLLFTQTSKEFKGHTPLQYLELLSWLICPEDVAEELPKNFGQDKIEKIVSLTDELPPIPQVAGRALQLLNNPESSWTQLAEVLEQDASLLTTILKAANSALYSSGQEITNLQTAVAKLGLTIIRSLILTATTRTIFPTDNPKIEALSKPLWRHSKGCGIAARIIAKAVHYSDPEEAFVGGLLHDIGKLAILLNFPEEYEAVANAAQNGTTSLHVIEKERLGFDHTDIGQMLTAKWHMPKALQTCVHYHHSPQEASDTYRQLTMIVHMADLQNQLCINPHPDFQESKWLSTKQLCRELDIDDNTLEEIKKDIKESTTHIDSLDG